MIKKAICPRADCGGQIVAWSLYEQSCLLCARDPYKWNWDLLKVTRTLLLD